MQAVIMAGGKGTRLQSISKEIPKPMFPILHKPILEYQLDSLKKSGVLDIVFVVGYLGHVIQSYFGDGTRFGVRIRYIMESAPLGTAGALYYLKDQIKDDFLLIFGDLLLDVDWDRFMEFHKNREALITLYGHPNSHPYDSDLLVIDEKGKVLKIEAKNKNRDFWFHNFVNAGVYCVNPKLLATINKAEKIDLEKNLIAGQIASGNVYAYRCTEYVKDMGTPERLRIVTHDIESGIVESRSLRNKQKAVFLDRDGTINVLKGFLQSVNDLELLPNVVFAIKKLNESEFLTIVATNQPVVARGECSFDELEDIHMAMETQLGGQGAYIDDLFFCPHHPHKGYAGEVAELKFDCECRKPKIGMLERAAEKYNIDFNQSWFVGDSTSDVQTGANAGMRTILVETGMAGADQKYQIKADFVARDLLEAVEIILKTDLSMSGV